MDDSLLSRFIGGTISTGFGSASSLVLGLLGTMVAVRYLPAEAFGAFVLLEVVAGFLRQFSSLGLDYSTAKFITSTEDQQHRRRLINTAICFRLFMIFAMSLVALIAKPALSAVFGSSLTPTLVAFVPLLFLLESLSGLLKSALQGCFLFRRIGITDFITGFLNFLLILALVSFMDLGVLGLIYARVISLSLSCAFAFFSTPIKKQLEFDSNILKEMLVFGFPLQINDILTFMFQRIDTLIIGTLLGPASIAYYEMARKIPDSLGQLYEAFRSVFFPIMSRLFALGEQKKAAQILNSSTRLVSFVSILGALIAVAFGHDVIVLLFSDKYIPSVPAFVVLMIALSLSLVGNVLGTSLVAVGESDKPAIVNVVHTAASLLGNLIFIPIFGIVGAALASLAGPSATNPLNVFFLQRRKVDVRVWDYLKPILILGACLLLVLLLKPTAFLQKVSIIVFFILACMLLSVVNGQDLNALFGEARVTLSKLLRRLPSRGTKT